MKNFDEIYKQILSTGTADLDKLKRTRNLLLLLLLIVFVISCIIFLNTNQGNSALMIVMMVFGIALLIAFFIENNNYKRKFKDQIISKLIKAYDPTFTFSDMQGISRREYDESGFNYNYNKYYSEDLIQGIIAENYSFRMSQVNIQDVHTYTDSNGGTRTETVTLFNGLYGVVDTQDLMNFQMEISSDNKLKKYAHKRIEVDSSEFEKQYDMFSDDKVSSMEIFTSELIEELNHFKKETKKVIQIKIEPHRLYFRIPCGEVFEAPNFKSAISYEYLNKNFDLIDFPVKIVNRILENAHSVKV